MYEVQYITPEDLVKIIDIIKSFDYAISDEEPSYDEEPEKIDDYFSLIDRLKNDVYYPNIFSKAASLFLNINNGHYFYNGNKRLAVVSLISFLENNGLRPKDLNKGQYSSMLIEIFNVENLEDYENFSATDFAMYNLALITTRFNQNQIDHEVGKKLVSVFLKQVYKLE